MRWDMGARGPLKGVIQVPGDKSLSHRALMFSALAAGESRIKGLLLGEDVVATRNALLALGVEVTRVGDAHIIVPPEDGLIQPSAPLHCGNSRVSAV